MLRGSLDDFSLEDILWLVARGDKTGELFVNRPPGSGRFFFASGRVDHIETDLLRGGAPGGDARATAEDAAFELLRRELGDFTWNPGVAAQSGTALGLSVDDVLAASSQRAAELATIRRFIPSEQSVIAVSANPPEDVQEVTLTRAQWGLLAFVDGRRSVEGIATEAGLGEFHVLRTLYPLAERRLVDVRDAAQGGLPDATAQPGNTAAPVTTPPAQVDLTTSPEAAPTTPAAFPSSETP